MQILSERGIRCLRFPNRQIWNGLPAVVAAIEVAFETCRHARRAARRRRSQTGH